MTEIHVKGVTGLAHNKFSGHVPGSKQQAVYVHLNNDDVKREMNEKVYNVQELTPDQKTKYDQEIAGLKGQLSSVKELLEGFRATIGQLVPAKTVAE